jgi:hypothetical protein
LKDLKIAVYAVQWMGLIMIRYGMTVNTLGRVAASWRTVKTDIMNNEGGECDGDW